MNWEAVSTRDGHADIFADAHGCGYPHYPTYVGFNSASANISAWPSIVWIHCCWVKEPLLLDSLLLDLDPLSLDPEFRSVVVGSIVVESLNPLLFIILHM